MDDVFLGELDLDLQVETDELSELDCLICEATNETDCCRVVVGPSRRVVCRLWIHRMEVDAEGPLQDLSKPLA